MGGYLTTLDTRVYRMLFKEWADALLAPARSPTGRSHYNGQTALYLSGTPEGCTIASRRYVKSDDPSRAIYPLHITADKIVDLRDKEATKYFGIDTTHRATDWLPYEAAGQRSPTWDISDRIRNLNLDGFLYASRSKPSLTHLTLFHWNTPSHAQLRADGSPLPASFD